MLAAPTEVEVAAVWRAYRIPGVRVVQLISVGPTACRLPAIAAFVEDYSDSYPLRLVRTKVPVLQRSAAAQAKVVLMLAISKSKWNQVAWALESLQLDSGEQASNLCLLFRIVSYHPDGNPWVQLLTQMLGIGSREAAT